MEEDNARQTKKKRHPSLARRRDVLFKTIIRDVRKYFIAEFNDSTSYIKKKRYKPSPFYLEKVAEFIANTLQPLTVDQQPLRFQRRLPLFLAALLYPKDLLKSLSVSSPEKPIADEVHSTLYNFSLEKLQALLTHPEMAFLFRVYYSEAIEK